MWNDVVTSERFFRAALRRLSIAAQAGPDLTLCVAQAGLELSCVAQDHLEH